MRRSLIAGSACAAAFAATALGLGARAVAPKGQYAFTETSRVVFDNYTKLTWQRSVSPDNRRKSSAASDYCAKLDLEGHVWRVPDMRELATLVDVHSSDPAIDRAAFPGTPSKPFWSTNEVVGNPGSTWAVNFQDGSSYRTVVDEAIYVRCITSK